MSHQGPNGTNSPIPNSSTAYNLLNRALAATPRATPAKCRTIARSAGRAALCLPRKSLPRSFGTWSTRFFNLPPRTSFYSCSRQVRAYGGEIERRKHLTKQDKLPSSEKSARTEEFEEIIQKIALLSPPERAIEWFLTRVQSGEHPKFYLRILAQVSLIFNPHEVMLTMKWYSI